MSIRQRRPREGTRNRGAVDALQTKIAVSLQRLESESRNDQLQSCIDDLPEAAGVDCAVLCLFSEDGQSIEEVLNARSGFARCSPDVLEGENLGDWPQLMQRLGHLRAIEVDNVADSRFLSADESNRFAELNMGAVLIVGFSVHGEIAGFLGLAMEEAVETWDAALHLLVKLFGASLATGLERLKDQEILADLRERHELVSLTANDGIWDFDGQSKTINLSPRWKRMLGFREEDDDPMLDWYRLVHTRRHGTRAGHYA